MGKIDIKHNFKGKYNKNINCRICFVLKKICSRDIHVIVEVVIAVQNALECCQSLICRENEQYE